MNVQLKDITVTARDGRVSHLEQVYIRGSHVRFFIVPDMLRYAKPTPTALFSGKILPLSFRVPGLIISFHAKQECSDVQISKRSWTWCWSSKRSRNSQQGAGRWTRRRRRSWWTWLRHLGPSLEYWTTRRRDVGFCRHDENSIALTAASTGRIRVAQIIASGWNEEKGIGAILVLAGCRSFVRQIKGICMALRGSKYGRQRLLALRRRGKQKGNARQPGKKSMRSYV